MVEGCLHNWKFLTSDVPLGSVLEALLHLIHVNGLDMNGGGVIKKLTDDMKIGDVDSEEDTLWQQNKIGEMGRRKAGWKCGVIHIARTDKGVTFRVETLRRWIAKHLQPSSEYPICQWMMLGEFCSGVEATKDEQFPIRLVRYNSVDKKD